MYQPKDSQVCNRQLKVQKVSIPFTITANATPASKTTTNDEPGLLFLRLEGIDNITEASGALAAGETMPGSLATAADATGTFVVLVKINEPLEKVVSVKLVGRNATSIMKSCEVEGFTSVGKSVVASVVSGVNLATTSQDMVLEVEYVVSEA